ncbi:hypothetical protein HF086_008764 [Spodoptera exigua]|uniref:Uncharacterized protein n=1 Tax=Spodoptera exigua TaxID=7107 RepID=A0A922MC54_SPOEX|nr:hypothetical protein HF086_008764 [Spodoptera exigua]
MNYITSELDEMEREETFRLKRFKQLKYVRVDKGKPGEAILEEEPLPKPNVLPVPQPPKSIPEPPKSIPEPPKVIPQPPKIIPPPKVEIPPPKVEIPPPKIEIPPAEAEYIKPKEKEVIPIKSVCSCHKTPEEKPSVICPPCELEEGETFQPVPSKTVCCKERLEHLKTHINHLIELIEQLNAKEEFPDLRKETIIKSCEAMKIKIEEVSYPPPPCDICQKEPPIPEPPCATVPASTVPSCIPSICSKLAPSAKSSRTAPPEIPPIRSLLLKSSQQKLTLSCFETEYKEIVRITTSLNPDGTMTEEKQIITVKTERRNPMTEDKKGDEGYATPCCKNDNNDGGAGGFDGGVGPPTDDIRSCRVVGVCGSGMTERPCGGSQKGTSGDFKDGGGSKADMSAGGGSARRLSSKLSFKEGGVCQSKRSALRLAGDNTTKSTCMDSGVCSAPTPPNTSIPPPATSATPAAAICDPCAPPITRKPCPCDEIYGDKKPSIDTIPSIHYSLEIYNPSRDAGMLNANAADENSKAAKSSADVRTCKNCGVCTITDSAPGSAYDIDSWGSMSQCTCDDYQSDAVCGSRCVITEYVTTIYQNGKDNVDACRKACRTVGCGSSYKHTKTFLTGFNPHPPISFNHSPRGAPAASKSTTTSLKHSDSQLASDCTCKASKGTEVEKMTSARISELSSVASSYSSPIAELKDVYCETDAPLCKECVSASTSAQSAWNYPLDKKMCDKSTFCIPNCSTRAGVGNIDNSLFGTGLRRDRDLAKPTSFSCNASKISKVKSLTRTGYSDITLKPQTPSDYKNKDAYNEIIYKGCLFNDLRQMIMARSISTQCSEATMVSGMNSSSSYHSQSETMCQRCSTDLRNNPTCYTYLESRDYDLKDERCVYCGTLGQFSTPSTSLLSKNSAVQSTASQKTSPFSKSYNSSNSRFSECKSICSVIAKQIRSGCGSPLQSEICCPKPGSVRKVKEVPKPIAKVDAMTSTKRCDRFDCRPLLAFSNNHTCARIRKNVCACHSDSHVCATTQICPILQRSKSCCHNFYRRC